jgi:hypothetical protein
MREQFEAWWIAEKGPALAALFPETRPEVVIKALLSKRIGRCGKPPTSRE